MSLFVAIQIRLQAACRGLVRDRIGLRISHLCRTLVDAYRVVRSLGGFRISGFLDYKTLLALLSLLNPRCSNFWSVAKDGTDLARSVDEVNKRDAIVMIRSRRGFCVIIFT